MKLPFFWGEGSSPETSVSLVVWRSAMADFVLPVAL